MAESIISPFYVRVSQISSEPVPQHRKDTYAWLAPKLLDSRPGILRQASNSIYLTAEQMRQSPSAIQNLLRPPAEASSRECLIILDLADNPYHLLREIFLYHVADTVVRWLRQYERCKIVVLLPLMPPSSSLFWEIDRSVRSGSRDEVGRLAVLASDGEYRYFFLAAADLNRYRISQMLSNDDLRAQLRSRIVRKRGHYAFAGRHGIHCSRFFFETGAADRQIGDLVVRWAEEKIRPHVRGGRFTLVSHGKHAQRFHEAVAGAAAALGSKFAELDLDTGLGMDQVDGAIALVLNVVHTGDTYKKIISMLREKNFHLAPEALTVLAVDEELPHNYAQPRLSPLISDLPRLKVAKDECEQCVIGLPHTDPPDDELVSIRAFDMWDILRDSPFHPEPYGPSSRLRPRLPLVPDMRQIFSRHGDWIAHKIGLLLAKLEIDSDVVFISPEEPIIDTLTTRLSEIRQNRQIAIQIPRPVLDAEPMVTEVRANRNEEWHRQLRHLGEQDQQNIVLLDEFVRSYSTARAMVNLLRSEEFSEFGMRVKAYVPIVDFSNGSESPIMKTYPLYRLPLP